MEICAITGSSGVLGKKIKKLLPYKFYEFKDDVTFNFIINIGNLKILPGDYEVELSSKLITQFKNKEVNVTYWIALEKTSTFGV